MAVTGSNAFAEPIAHTLAGIGALVEPNSKSVIKSNCGSNYTAFSGTDLSAKRHSDSAAFAVPYCESDVATDAGTDTNTGSHFESLAFADSSAFDSSK